MFGGEKEFCYHHHGTIATMAPWTEDCRSRRYCTTSMVVDSAVFTVTNSFTIAKIFNQSL